MNRTSPPTKAVSHHQVFFYTVAALLEERIGFGDRRRYPDFKHPHCHPVTDRRSGHDRRDIHLGEEIFDSGG